MIVSAIVAFLTRGAVLGVINTVFGILKNMPWQVWVAIGLVIAGLWVYHKGENDGATRIQARWDQAVTNQIKVGNDARAKAEATIPPAPAVAPTKPCVVRNAYDRDCK